MLELQVLDSCRVEGRLKRSNDILGIPVKKNTYVFCVGDCRVVDCARAFGIAVEEIPAFVRVN